MDDVYRCVISTWGKSNHGNRCLLHQWWVASSQSNISTIQVKVKVIPQQAEVAQGVPGRLRPRIFLTFGTTRVVGRQPYAPATFAPGEIPGTNFQRLSRPQGTWFRREPRKKFPVTPLGIDPGTSRLVAQCLNHYATPDPQVLYSRCKFKQNSSQIPFLLLIFTSNPFIDPISYI